ncbi:hypothetical protein IG631_17997 [Alternaria alternata]|nr:hypothetical protein IG631_17997 [Alternaria alternata]
MLHARQSSLDFGQQPGHGCDETNSDGWHVPFISQHPPLNHRALNLSGRVNGDHWPSRRCREPWIGHVAAHRSLSDDVDCLALRLLSIELITRHLSTNTSIVEKGHSCKSSHLA